MTQTMNITVIVVGSRPNETRLMVMRYYRGDLGVYTPHNTNNYTTLSGKVGLGVCGVRDHTMTPYFRPRIR